MDPGNQKEIFLEKLLVWHKNNSQKYLWRRTRDPYKILIAEMLLKKTTRKQVNEIYKKFILKFPSAKMLMNADKVYLEKILKPLGMQKKRAEILIRMATYIVRNLNNKIPRDKNELIKIDGVGPYAANAVLCLAYNKPFPLVDTNVARVIQRVFSFKSDKSRARTDPNLWKFVEQLIPKDKAKNFNLAMLDFGNVICRSKNPLCQACPMLDICIFKQSSY